MKELKSIFIFSLIVAFVLYVGVGLIVNTVFNVSGNIWILLVSGTVTAFLFSCGLLLLVNSLLKGRLAFLNSEETLVPEYGDRIQKVIPVETAGFSFEVIKYRIKEEYEIVTYDDVEHYVVKFRSRLIAFSWGTAGCAVYDPVSATVTLSCFPMVAHTDKAARNVQIMFEKVEKLIS